MKYTKEMIALMITALVACGDDKQETVVADADSGDLEDDVSDATADDTTLIEVDVPSEPRGFRMGLNVPVDVPNSEFGSESFLFAEESADFVTVTLDNGLPWEEILAGGSLPADYESYLANLADKVLRTGKDVLVIVDPFNADRTGFVPDLYGRQSIDDALLTMTRANASNGYIEFCEELAVRFEADYFIPFVDVDIYSIRRSADAEGVRETYLELRENLKLAQSNVLVFPSFDFERVKDVYDTGDADEKAYYELMDPVVDLFAVSFYPTISDIAFENPPAEYFDFLDRRKTPGGIQPVTTRPLAIIGTGVPAATIGGETGTENSQYNFLAAILAAGDRNDMEFINWRVGIDLDEWIVTPCNNEPLCDAARISTRLSQYRSFGLRDSGGDDRSSAVLWNEFRARNFVR